jgi:hypothetical protein
MALYAIAVDGTQICGYRAWKATPPWLWLLRAGDVTVRKGYLPQAVAPVAGVIDAWLRTDITLRASVIHERLAGEHGFTRSCQRVKVLRSGHPI